MKKRIFLYPILFFLTTASIFAFPDFSKMMAFAYYEGKRGTFDIPSHISKTRKELANIRSSPVEKLTKDETAWLEYALTHSYNLKPGEIYSVNILSLITNMQTWLIVEIDSVSGNGAFSYSW